MTQGERRKQLKIELHKQYGINATKKDVAKIRKIAAKLA